MLPSKPVTFMSLMIIILLALFTPTSHAQPSTLSQPQIQVVAWEHEGRVKLAVANTSSRYQEITAAFGYQRLGRRIVEEYFIDVPPKSIVVEGYPKIVDMSQSGARECDTVYLFDDQKQQVAVAQIVGIHSATNHFRVESHLVPAGQDAVVYLETPYQEPKKDTKIFISVGKKYTLGTITGRVRVRELHEGGFIETTNPHFGDMEKPEDYHNYSYGWRGLVITMATPRVPGLTRLDFQIEKFIYTPDGTARHGLAAPPILVYGRDITLVEW
ncbi:MAG: hypothetical protein GX316_11405 [Firmicutes bacterium]|nr:hypothetical protein [Bacillota bacterium]